MNGRNAWCKVTVALWCAASLVAACSGTEDAAAPAGDAPREAGPTREVVQASQAKAYPDCQAVGRDAGAFLKDRHALDRPGEPEWPSKSISCNWSFSDDERCQAIGFVPGSGGEDCISDTMYITVNRGVGGMDSAAEARAHFGHRVPGSPEWVEIDDPRLRAPGYANIAVFKQADNYSINWEFRMAVTGSSNLEPLPTEVVVRHTLRHPGGTKPHEELTAMSPPPPSDTEVVSGYLEMLEAFEAPRTWR